MNRAWMTAPLLLALAGCASLEITVDVYDGPLLRVPRSAQATSNAISASRLCELPDKKSERQTALRELIRPELERLGERYVEIQREQGAALTAQFQAAMDAAQTELDAATKAHADAAKALADAKAKNKPKKQIAALETDEADKKTKLDEAQTKLNEAKQAYEASKSSDAQLRSTWCADDNDQPVGCFTATRGVGKLIIDDWVEGPAPQLARVCERNEVLATKLQERHELVGKPRQRMTPRVLERLSSADEAIAASSDLLDQALASYHGALAKFIEGSAIAITPEAGRVGASRDNLEVILGDLELDADREAGIAAEGPVNGRIAGYPLFDRLFLQVLRNSKPDSPHPDLHWSRMSRTKSWASGGNNQFVMVRQGLLVFHQKSLDFDPTPIIGAASASARLGLALASQIASGATGVPLAKPEQGSSDAAEQPETDASATEVEIEQLRRRVEIIDEAEREALRELAALLDDLDALDANDTEGRAAIRERLDAITRRFQGRIDRN